MGIGSNLMVELAQERYLNEKLELFRVKKNNPEADEYTLGWDEFSEEHDSFTSTWNDSDFYEFDSWEVNGKERIDIFNETIRASKEILKSKFSSKTSKNILVMLHGHVVAAVESYLSSTFISISLSSEKYLRALVENYYAKT